MTYYNHNNDFNDDFNYDLTFTSYLDDDEDYFTVNTNNDHSLPVPPGIIAFFALLASAMLLLSLCQCYSDWNLTAHQRRMRRRHNQRQQQAQRQMMRRARQQRRQQAQSTPLDDVFNAVEQERRQRVQVIVDAIASRNNTNANNTNNSQNTITVITSTLYDQIQKQMIFRAVEDTDSILFNPNQICKNVVDITETEISNGDNNIDDDDNDGKISAPTNHPTPSPSWRQTIASSLRSTLRRITTATTGAATESTRAECSICLEGYHVGETICWAKSNDCNHIFHDDCIIEWLKEHEECPLCRTNIMKATKSSSSTTTLTMTV